jgi:multiple sugar transport system substrate-binding protein
MRTKKPRRLLMAAALATTAAVGMTAAASATTEPTDTTTAEAMVDTTAPAAPSGDGAQLRLWGFSSGEAEDAALSDLVAQYSEQSGVNVVVELQPDYDTTLQAALSAGDPPDIFYVDSSRLPDLADAGALAPVPEGAITEPDDIYPSLTEAFTYDGTWYCPPKDFSTLGLFYNTDLLEAAGVEPPTTMEELAAAAEALTTEDVVGLSFGPELARVGAFMLANGGYIVNDDVTEMTLDTEENRAALQYIADLAAAGSYATPASVEAGWGGEAFGQGKAAMVIEGNWLVPALERDFPDVNWGVVELPAGSAGPATFAFTVCYGVSPEAANPEASWEVIDYLTGPEGAAAWTSGFAVMPARESLREGWLEEHPELEPLLNGAEYAHKWQFIPGFADVTTEFNSQFEQLIAGDTDVDGLVESVTEAGESVL